MLQRPGLGKPENARDRAGRRRGGFGKVFAILALCGGLCMAPAVRAAPSGGLAMHGAPALAPDYAHLPHANPDAPQGGAIRFGEVGGFDSLNPFVLKGSAPWQLRWLQFESLMGRNWDEPFTLYPLLAESWEAAEDRSWIEFALDPQARFSDGSPVLAADVLAAFETLAAEGTPGYRTLRDNIASAEALSERRLRFVFRAPEREAPLVLALLPVFKPAPGGRAFAEGGLEPLIGTGPWRVGPFEPGRRIVFRRDRDHWARGRPYYRGQHNLDEIVIEYFRDANAVWEAFKVGAIDIFRDEDPARWAEGYDFAAATEGRIVKSEIPHGRPSGMRGFVFNTRRAPFDDIRVREALTLAFDFDWVRRTMLAGAFERTGSYFGGSPLAHSGRAEGREREILAPHEAALPAGALEAAVAQPVSEGDGRNRANLRRAADLLAEAGWTVQDGRLRDAAGRPFGFEILLSRSADEQIAGVWAEALKRLGVEARPRLVDRAQYLSRLTDYDFDTIVNAWAMSLSPGIEQVKYWGAAGVEAPGTRNYMGVANPAVEAALAALMAAEDRAELEAATRALDRALTALRLVVPLWHAPTSRIAHDAKLRFPARTPLYGDWIGFLPDVWWREE